MKLLGKSRSRVITKFWTVLIMRFTQIFVRSLIPQCCLRASLVFHTESCTFDITFWSTAWYFANIQINTWALALDSRFDLGEVHRNLLDLDGKLFIFQSLSFLLGFDLVVDKYIPLRNLDVRISIVYLRTWFHSLL